MTDRRSSTSHPTSHLSHHYPTYPSAPAGYPSAAAYGVHASSAPHAYVPQGHYTDYELQSAGSPMHAYYSTPRSAMDSAPHPGMQHNPQAPAYNVYPQPTQAMPIPNQRTHYSAHGSPINIPYQSGFAPSSASPRTPGSPDSPLSPLAQYAYSPSAMEAAGQYPASPQRPYACDLCVLSFSRQHDLKRHRDTHSGK
jgi:hypothetical protein